MQRLNVKFWDVLVTFGTGIMTIVQGGLLYTIFFRNGQLEKLISSDLPTVSVLLVGIPIVLAIGLIIDALANVLGDPFINWLFKVQQAPPDIKKLATYVKKNYIPDELQAQISPYHWCKDYLIQNEIESPFMDFLSKFGFYRNLAFLFYSGAVVVLVILAIQRTHVVETIAVLVLSIPLGVVCTIRSRSFYRHMGRAVFRHFLIARKTGTNGLELRDRGGER